MLDKFKKQFLDKFGKKKEGLSDDDDLLSELGLDEDLSASVGDISEDGINLESVSSRHSKLSLSVISYITLALTIIFCVGGGAILIMSNNTQSSILDNIKDEKEILSSKINKIREEINLKDSINSQESKVAEINAETLYELKYDNRFLVTDIVNEYDHLISTIKSNSIFVKILRFNIDAVNNSVSFAGETNSVTNLGKIIQIINSSDFFRGASINGITKTLNVEGLSVIPFNFNLKFGEEPIVEITEEETS